MNNQIFFGFLNLALALFVTIKITPELIIFGRKFNLIDKSDRRKRNRANMVRIGGIAIFLGFFVSQIIWFCFYFSFNSFDIENILLNKNSLLALFGMLFFFSYWVIRGFSYAIAFSEACFTNFDYVNNLVSRI